MSVTTLSLFRLPKALLVQFLSEWLDIYDVGKLDSSITNNERRPEFSQCLKEMRNPTVPDTFDGSLVHDVAMLGWISRRQIHVEALFLEDFENNEFIESRRLPSLQKLTAGTQYDICPTWLRQVPQLSPKLEELAMGQFRKYDGRSINAMIEDLIFVLSQCLQLSSVTIDKIDLGNCTDDVLAGIQEFGHLLVDIHLICGADHFDGEFSEIIKKIIRHCPRLQKLGYCSYWDDGSLLMCIVQSCPLLEDITFDKFSAPALLKLSQNCKFLRKIEICWYDEDILPVPASALEVLKHRYTGRATLE